MPTLSVARWIAMLHRNMLNSDSDRIAKHRLLRNRIAELVWR